MNNIKGENLIFLISQPRSGSTLAQRIIGSHPEVYTHSEPWVLLHPLHAFKSNNIHTPYESDLYASALKGFIKTIPGGDRTYIKEISRVYSSFYDTILKNNGKSLFLDKTPRYYYIIEELKQYFPKAKFVFLWRNPAAVIASIMNSWTKENWYRLAWHKDDLLFAPNEMISGIKFLGKDAYSLSYENLISDPVTQIKQLCKFLGIEYYDQMIDYGKNNVVKWEFGDQKTINERERPDAAHANNWISDLKKIQFWRVVSDYIGLLGSDTITGMGYSIAEIMEILEKNKPKGNIDQQSMPLSSFMDNTRDAVIENKRMSNQIKGLIESVKLKDEQINQRNQEFQQLKDELNSTLSVLQQKDYLLMQRGDLIKQKDLQIAHIDELLKQKHEDLNQRNESIKQKDILLKQRYEIINQKDKLINQRNDTLKQKDALIQLKNTQLDDLKSHKEHLISRNQELLKKIEEDSKLIAQLKQEVAEKTESLRLLEIEDESKAKTIKRNEELLLLNSNVLREKSQQLLIIEEKLISCDELIRNIEQSYTFRIGKLITFPVRKILGR